MIYKGLDLGLGYRGDLLINHKVIIELKTVSELKDEHLAQVLTYLKLLDVRLGMLLNFNTDLMKFGIKRVVNKL